MAVILRFDIETASSYLAPGLTMVTIGDLLPEKWTSDNETPGQDDGGFRCAPVGTGLLGTAGPQANGDGTG
jgi:hypothetical protein